MSAALNMNANASMEKRDPVRPGPRVKLEIESYATGTAVPGWGRCLRRGKNVGVIINRDDLSAVEAKIETELKWVEEAKATHQLQTVVHVEKVSKRALSEDAKQTLRQWCVKDYTDRDETDLASLETVHQNVARRYTGSWEAEFTNIALLREGKARGRKPIKSFKIVEDLEPEMSEQAMMVRDIVGKQNGGLDAETLGKAMAVMHAEISKQQEKRKGA